jgi:hypothetical protein
VSDQADLDLLRARLGVKGDDANGNLARSLDVATAWVEDRVYVEPDAGYGRRHPEVTEAILLIASRLFARRNSPEGVAGWGDLGVVRIIARDPDVDALLERHIDYAKAGIA